MLYLVRHCSTSENDSKILCSDKDIELSENGLKQASKLSEWFADKKIAIILSSDMLRATQTSDFIRKVTKAPIEKYTELRERKVSVEYSSLLLNELLAIRLSKSQKYFDPTQDWDNVPDVESDETVFLRTKAILQHIKTLFRMLNDHPELKSKINIYLHHTIPIGNVSILDNHVYLVNRYLFFEESPKTLWFELSEGAADTQRIIAYFEKVKKDKPKEINKLSDLEPLENTELKELLTVLDMDGKPTNFNRAREIVHRRGYLHRSVHIWIVNSKQEVLLQKRGSNVEVSKNLWGCACTGHIIAGKSSLESVVDEVSQELGIDISSIVHSAKVEKIGEFRHNFTDDKTTFHDNEINDVYLIEMDKPIAEYTIEENLVEEIKFMDYKEFEADYKANPKSYVTSYKEEHKLIIKTLKHKFESHSK